MAGRKHCRPPRRGRPNSAVRTRPAAADREVPPDFVQTSSVLFPKFVSKKNFKLINVKGNGEI